MALNGPRICAYCYSEGPATGAAAAIVSNSTIAAVEQATGLTWYARPTGPELFDDQLSTLGTGLTDQAGAGNYRLSYDADTERVTFETTNGIAFRPVMVGRGAEWFGFTQDLSSGWATSWVGDSTPAACAELVNVFAEPAEDVTTEELKEYRLGRTAAIAWGNHQAHRITLTADGAALDSRFWTTGRVRIWQAGDGSAYHAENVDGYIDGFVIAASDVRADGDFEELVEIELRVGVSR